MESPLDSAIVVQEDDSQEESPLDSGFFSMNSSTVLDNEHDSDPEEDMLTQELIDEIERLQEAVVEEFLERAYAAKYDRLENLKS